MTKIVAYTMNEQFIHLQGKEMENKRLKEIYEAASCLFIRQGYSKTQISHIAKAIGVSVGTIYHDFTGKKEIMHFVLKCTIDPNFINREFDRPITDDVFSGLEKEIISTFEGTLNNLSSHLSTNAEDYTFEALISDAFDLLSKYAVGCLFIEKNQNDCGKLAGYYKEHRKKFYMVMLKYVSIFIEKGIVRQLKYPELSVNVIIEILTWWGMDMRYCSFETWDIPNELAKEVCMDNIITAYKI